MARKGHARSVPDGPKSSKPRPRKRAIALGSDRVGRVWSKTLRLSEVQRRLLTYLVEKSLAGEADDLKEYTIGIDAFGKPPSYDPRQQSVVRMHVARLRQKLAEYYRAEGAADPLCWTSPRAASKWCSKSRRGDVSDVVRSFSIGVIEHPTLESVYAVHGRFQADTSSMASAGLDSSR